MRARMKADVKRRGIQWFTVLWLTIVWIGLWGSLTWGTLFAGLAVGIAVSWLFPMPRFEFHGRVHPWFLFTLCVRFVYDVIRASVHVVALSLNFRKKPKNAIIRVQLRSHSDLYLTMTANITTLVPGSVVLEANRVTGTLYIHALDVNTPEDVERIREDVLTTERRVLRALASPEELVDCGYTSDKGRLKV